MYVFFGLCVPEYIYSGMRVHHSWCLRVCVWVCRGLICGNAFISGRRKTSEKYFSINTDCTLEISCLIFK